MNPISTDNRTCRLQHLTMINQVAGPLAVELLTDLSAMGVDCRVVTGQIDAEHPQELPFAVSRAMRLRKSPAWRRLLSWAMFTMEAVFHMAAHRSGPVLITTNPPLVMLLGCLLRRFLGIRYVLLVYDIYPDVLERMGKIKPGGAVSRWWRGKSRRAMLAAEAVITLGDHMAQTLRGHLKGGDDCRIDVIPNWADTDLIRPLPKRDNPFAIEHGLADKFVVMYSGAFGATHDVESIITAAGMLTDLDDVRFVLIGGGTRQREVSDLVAAGNLPNLVLLPFQPFARLPFSLACADCAIVCLDEGYEGISVPSKTYYALSAGAALLAVSPNDTELTDIVNRFGCGLHIPPRSPRMLADSVRGLHANRDELARMRSAGREAAKTHFSRKVSAEQFHATLTARLGK